MVCFCVCRFLHQPLQSISLKHFLKFTFLNELFVSLWPRSDKVMSGSAISPVIDFSSNLSSVSSVSPGAC